MKKTFVYAVLMTVIASSRLLADGFGSGFGGGLLGGVVAGTLVNPGYYYPRDPYYEADREEARLQRDEIREERRRRAQARRESNRNSNQEQD